MVPKLSVSSDINYSGDIVYHHSEERTCHLNSNDAVLPRFALTKDYIKECISSQKSDGY